MQADILTGGLSVLVHQQKNLFPGIFSCAMRQIKGYKIFGVGTSSQVVYVPNLAKHVY